MVLDTNVLLYAVEETSDLREPCRRLLDRARRGPSPTFLTWSVCYELLRVSAHPRVSRSPLTSSAAVSFILSLMNSPGFQMLVATPRHAAVLKNTVEEFPELRGSVMHDLHTAVLMREHGINRVCTCDRHFRRFPFLTVVDPMSETRDYR